MILRLGSGWQTVTADLALILFLITAQASREGPEGQPQVEPPVATTMVDADGAGLAIYRPGPGTNLGEWLEATLTDDRQGATVVMRYPEGGRDEAFRSGAALLDMIERQGSTARLLLEPGSRNESMVLVGYTGERADGTVLAERE